MQLIQIHNSLSRGTSLNPLNLDGGIESLLLLLLTLLGLGAHDTTTPGAASALRVGKVAILDGGDKLGQLALVLRADLGEGENSSGLSR